MAEIVPTLYKAKKGGVQTTIEAAQAAGAGVVVVPKGVYTETVEITDPTPIRVLAYGATLQATANGQTLLRSEIGVSSLDNQQVVVSGFTLDDAGFAGVVGSEICDSLGVVYTDLIWEAGLSIPHLWHNKAVGMYTERCGLERCIARNPTSKGVEYRITDGNSSFNNTWMHHVFISLATDGTIGVDQGAGCNFERVDWQNVVVWLSGANQTGYKFDGMLDGSRLSCGVESFPAAYATAVGVEVGLNYTYYRDPYAYDLSLGHVGTFANKVLDLSAGAGIAWRDGANYYVSDYAQVFQLFRGADTQPRMKLSYGGISLGPGGATAPDVLLNRSGVGQAGLNADLKFTNSSDGPLLIDRTTATVYRLYANNGALAIETA